MKKHKRKRIFSLLMVTLMSISFITLFTSCAQKDEIPIPTVMQDVYVYDEDNIIEDDVEESINSMLVDLNEKTGAEFAVITTESLLGMDIESYANHLFNTLGIGEEGKDNGVLLLMSRSDTRVRLEIGRGLEGYLNDGKCGNILDEYFVPYRENDDYSTATYQTVQAVLNVLAEEYQITIEGVDTSIVSSSENDNSYLGWALIIVTILLVVILIWGIIQSGGGGFGGSSGGGSFGGSSGGFGSFGGGFSGGGGASR